MLKLKKMIMKHEAEVLTQFNSRSENVEDEEKKKRFQNKASFIFNVNGVQKLSAVVIVMYVQFTD